MLDGVQAAEMLKGVRGSDPVNRDALASLIVRVSELVSDFPEISEMDLNPVFATKDGAIAADVRIVVDFNPAPARARPAHDDIVRSMNRIMRPDSVAVVGASAEDGKIGNSVMKNLINGGYKGDIYPIHPKADEILGYKAYKSVKDVPGDDRHGRVRDPREIRGRSAHRVRREEDPRRRPDPVGLCRDRQRAGGFRRRSSGDRQEVRCIRLMGPNIYGFYYTPENLCATFCTAYDVKGSRRAVSSQSGGIGMAIIGFSRSAKMGVSAIVGLGNKSDIDEDDLLDLLRERRRTPTSSPMHCEDLKDGRCLRGGRRSASPRRSRSSCSKAGRTSEPAPRPAAVPYRRARRQRQDL